MRRLRRAPDLPGITGVARVDVRTRKLTHRLRLGDLAVIDHVDLDKVSAESLIARGVGAVVNASPSISGRYPNLGPEVLARAGVPLLDDVGTDVLAVVDDGERLRLDGHFLYRGDQVIATGERLGVDEVQVAMARARQGLAVTLEAFVGDAVEHLRQERGLLLDGDGIPELRTPLEGRPVVVVVKGYDTEADLASLRTYLRDVRPVLIGVDEGADVLLAHGHRPGIVLGDLDTMSEAALTCGAEIVAHVTPDDRSTLHRERPDGLGMGAAVVPSKGHAEEAAMLLAHMRGASVIVAAGSHTTLAEFLDRGRSGMSSAFLTRLSIGGTYVDARAVAEMHRPATPLWPLLAMLTALVAILAALVVTGNTPSTDQFGSWWDSVADAAGGLV